MLLAASVVLNMAYYYSNVSSFWEFAWTNIRCFQFRLPMCIIPATTLAMWARVYFSTWLFQVSDVFCMSTWWMQFIFPSCHCSNKPNPSLAMSVVCGLKTFSSLFLQHLVMSPTHSPRISRSLRDSWLAGWRSLRSTTLPPSIDLIWTTATQMHFPSCLAISVEDQAMQTSRTLLKLIMLWLTVSLNIRQRDAAVRKTKRCSSKEDKEMQQ